MNNNVELQIIDSVIACIHLNRPSKLNAMDSSLRFELQKLLIKVTSDSKIRVIILTGNGKSFSSGVDIINDSDKTSIEKILNSEFAPIFELIRGSSQPVIAAINGLAAGIGMSLALTCDLRIMAEDTFLIPGFANIGLIPDGGLNWILCNEIGYARAFKIFIESERLNAETCLSLGLVNKLSRPLEVLPDSIKWARDLKQRAVLSVSLTKRALRASCQNGPEKSAKLEAGLQKIAQSSQDFQEGVDAIKEKRAPVFKGN